MNAAQTALPERDRPRRAAVPRLLRSPSARMRALPDYLLIGAQKAGTTSLQDYLAGADGVRAALVKEVHYFDHHADRGASWYRSHFPLTGTHRSWICGDATPYYLLHPWAPTRAAALLPEARLIAVLRNPVSRAYSHFQHSRALGAEPVTDFAEALALEQQRTGAAWDELVRTGKRQPTVEWFSYLRRSLYAPQLRRWLHAYPPDQLLILTADELFTDSRHALERVCRHLGLPPAAAARHLHVRHARSYPPMDDRVRRSLAEQLESDVGEVETVLGRATSWLNRAEPVS